MDAYDIFKKLTKGLTFKTRLLGKKPDVKHERSKITQEKSVVKLENNNSDDEMENMEDIAKNGYDSNNEQELLSSDDGDRPEIPKTTTKVKDEEYELNLMDGLTVTESGVKKKNKKKRRKKITEQKLTAIEKEEGRQLRIEHGIKVNGSEPPNPLKDFYSLLDKHEMNQRLVDNLIQCGYMEPTPIQRQAIPCMLENRQILACAPTGSGKTAAFILPILQTLKSPQRGSPRALVLCPTRELAKQIYREALRLSAGTNLVINFVPKISLEKIESKKAILNKTDILISTPNRLCYLLDHESSPLNLERVKWLIVDEADRLFEGKEGNESDFRPQLEKIMKACNILETSMAFFSATQTPVIVDWCRRNMDQLLCITVGQRNAATELVKQELLYVGNENGKLVAFRQLVQQGLQPPVLVFVQSKDRAKQLFKELLYDGINVDVIHADRTQLQRDNVVRSFRVGKIWVLICTELMGRGIDFRGVNLVINYDFPPSSISYVHRIGRAGRAGQTGRAVTFFTEDDLPNLKSIVVVMRQSGCEVPEYMLTLKQTRKNRKQMLKFAPKRDDISTELPNRQNRKRKLENNTENKDRKKMKMSDKVKQNQKEGTFTKKKPQFMKKALGKKSKVGKDSKNSNRDKNKSKKFSKNKKGK